MTASLPSLAKLQPNPQWAKLPLFSRKGWSRVRFGDVVRQLKEETDPVADGVERYVAGEHMQTENVHIREWGNVGDGYLGPAFIRRFRKGQVLYGSRRTYLKKVAVAECDGVTANTTFVLEAVAGKLLPDLLPWLMLSEKFTRHSVQESKGSTNPYINFPDIAKFEFDLPPLDQQRRIAEILWAVDEVRESVMILSKDVKSVMAAFSDNLFGERSEYNHTGKVTLGDVARLQSGYPFKSNEFVEQGDKLLRGSNVGVNRVDWSPDITRCFPSERRLEVSEFVLNTGDIVVAMDRPFISDGFKIARISEKDLPALLLQRVGRFQPSEKVHLEFLWLYLHSASFQQQLRLSQQGSDLPHISRFDIESTKLYVPTLKEQKRLVAEFNRLETGAKEMAEHEKNCSALAHAIIDAVFN